MMFAIRRDDEIYAILASHEAATWLIDCLVDGDESEQHTWSLGPVEMNNYQRGYDDGRKAAGDELVSFLVIWADRYQRDYGLDGLHPVHYDLMKKYGARMDDFKRASLPDYPEESTS